MHYQGTVIRPPSEAHSIVLQVTVGCSHNKCTFCGAYKDQRFQIKDEAIIERDLDFAADYCRRQKKVFLADGDVLVLPQKKLLSLFTRIRTRLPQVKKISLYANGKAIRTKGVDDLRALQELGLDRIYMGVESGHDTILATICKGETARSLKEAADKVHQCGIYLSTTVLLGIGGTDLSEQHAEQTGRLLSDMAPHHIGALTLMPLENTPLWHTIMRKEFRVPSPPDMLRELKTLVEHIDLERTLFYANHASNYLPLSGRLRRDKNKIIGMIDHALNGKTMLTPERFRAL